MLFTITELLALIFIAALFKLDPLAVIVKSLISEIETFKEDAQQNDDITIVAIRFA